MKTILLFLVAAALAIPLSLQAQSTNSAPVVSTTNFVIPAQTGHQIVSSGPVYRLLYNPTTKKITGLYYMSGTTATTWSYFTASTYAAVSAIATSNSLTGLPPQKPGQP